MCDQVIVTPEPEPGGELRPETDTGSGDNSQYTVIDDIGLTPQSQSESLPEISFDFDAYGQLILRDPGFSDQRGPVLSHTRETPGLSTCTVPITGGGDIMFREDARSSPASQQQHVAALDPKILCLVFLYLARLSPDHKWHMLCAQKRVDKICMEWT